MVAPGCKNRVIPVKSFPGVTIPFSTYLPCRRHAEADAALLMLKDLAKRSGRITVGADKAYDVAGLVSVLRELNVTPHVIQNNINRRSAIDGRTTRQVGYGISLGNAGWWRRLSAG